MLVELELDILKLHRAEWEIWTRRLIAIRISFGETAQIPLKTPDIESRGHSTQQVRPCWLRG